MATKTYINLKKQGYRLADHNACATLHDYNSNLKKPAYRSVFCVFRIYSVVSSVVFVVLFEPSFLSKRLISSPPTTPITTPVTVPEISKKGR